MYYNIIVIICYTFRCKSDY